MDDLDTLEQAAKRATPGPWAQRHIEFDDWGYIRSVTNGATVAIARLGDHNFTGDDFFDQHRINKTDPYEHNANYIALANPTTILSLTARVRAAEAENIKFREELMKSTQQENSEARRLRDAIVSARWHLAKGRAIWNDPCHQCDVVLEAALSVNKIYIPEVLMDRSAEIIAAAVAEAEARAEKAEAALALLWTPDDGSPGKEN